MQFVRCGGHTITVCGVHHKDNRCCVRVVTTPVRSDRGLSPQIPHVQFQVLVGQGLDVEPDGGFRGDDFADLQTVQDGGLPCPVEPQDEDPHLSVGAPQLVEQPAEVVSHGVAVVWWWRCSVLWCAQTTN